MTKRNTVKAPTNTITNTDCCNCGNPLGTKAANLTPRGWAHSITYSMKHPTRRINGCTGKLLPE